ncbi:MAG: hypothetical protein WA418_31810 [Bradyrhizobium sp.]
MADHAKTDQANAQFKKLQRADDGKKAMSEYEAERVAIRAKTERLRALRLARDAATTPVEAAPVKKTPVKKTPATKAPAKKTAVKKGKGKSLSEWLKVEEGSGRRS